MKPSLAPHNSSWLSWLKDTLKMQNCKGHSQFCDTGCISDMEFVQNFTPPDFQVKNFTPPISPNFNSFSKKKHTKLVKMEKFTPLAKKFTLLPAVTALTNSTSALVNTIPDNCHWRGCGVFFFTDLTQKIGVFRCKFYFPKILPV